jgi:DNA/RNA non-specific endonuclease
MLEGICKSGMTGAEAVAARTFARVIGSAIRAAASPGDPGQAFASAFLDDVFKQIDPPTNSNSNPNAATPVTPTAFDDEGRLNLGIVDPNATPEQQAQQLAAQLQRQGIPVAQANLMAQQALGNIVDGVAQLPQALVAAAPVTPEVLALNLPPDPLIVQGRLVPNAEHDRLIAELNAEFDIDADAPPPPLDDGPGQFERDPDFMPVGWVNDVGASAAAYAQRLASRVGGELGDLFQRAARAASTVLSYGDIAPLEAVKADIRNYLNARAESGLSEAEIILFGVLYAANETLFPTNAIEFAGGVGKVVKAAGAVVMAGRGADVLATTTRAISAEQAVARQVQAVEQAAKARGLEVIREVPGVKGGWNDSLSGSLKPRAVYLLDNGHAYVTDALGRVTKAEGLLDVSKVDRNVYQQLIAGKVGGEGYEGGHLIATLFGGAGEKINLIPQLTTVNRGEFRVLEKEWADAIRAGREVKVEVSPIYSGASKVPDEVRVSYWIDGVRDSRKFPNKPGG